MPYEDVQIGHLNQVIEFLQISRAAVIRGFEQAVEELGREGDLHDKNWAEAYQFLKTRLDHFKAT